MYRKVKAQRTHDHYARNAIALGHSAACQKTVGLWTTVDGVGVNWPTMVGRPECTCSQDAPNNILTKLSQSF